MVDVMCVSVHPLGARSLADFCFPFLLSTLIPLFYFDLFPSSALSFRTVFNSFADVAQPDQARIVALNAHHFLKNNGHVLISIKATCIDSTAPAEVVFASEVKKMQEEMLKPHEQLTLGESTMSTWLYMTRN